MICNSLLVAGGFIQDVFIYSKLQDDSQKINLTRFIDRHVKFEESYNKVPLLNISIDVKLTKTTHRTTQNVNKLDI